MRTFEKTRSIFTRGINSRDMEMMDVNLEEDCRLSPIGCSAPGLSAWSRLSNFQLDDALGHLASGEFEDKGAQESIFDAWIVDISPGCPTYSYMPHTMWSVPNNLLGGDPANYEAELLEAAKKSVV